MKSLRVGDKLCEPGQDKPRLEVIDVQLRDGCIKVFDFASTRDEYLKYSEIQQALVSGQLILRPAAMPSATWAPRNQLNDSRLEQDLQTALRHTNQVVQLMRKHDTSLAKAYEMAKLAHEQTDVEGGKFPSRATIYRHVHARRNSMPLLKGHNNKGNRTPRYSEPLAELICKTVDELFLRPESRWSLNDIVGVVNQVAKEQGLLGPEQNVSRTFVRKTVHGRLSNDPEIERMDPKLVAAAKSVANMRIVAAAPFERVEQDAVHLPFAVETPHGISSNIYLVHAIDCCTGLPVGWHIVIGAPTESDGLKCVESILFSKQDAFQRLNLDIDLDVYGTPHQLVLDNGPEARGPRIRKLARLGIDVTHCKSRHAQGKPYIERLNRSLKEGLQTLPGCTRVDNKDGQRDPQALGDKLMTLHELEVWVVAWYYKSWAHTPLKRHVRSDFANLVKMGNTPAQRWQTMTGELAFALPLSPTLQEWHLTLYEHMIRKVNRKTGISIDGLNYRGENLDRLIREHGTSSVNVLVNPDDFRVIYVAVEQGSPWIELTEMFVDEDTPAHSFAYMREELKRLKATVRDGPTKAAFLRGIRQRSAEMVAHTPGKRPRKPEKNRAVADRAKESMAIHRALTHPLPSLPPRNTGQAAASTVYVPDEEIPSVRMVNRVTGEKL